MRALLFRAYGEWTNQMHYFSIDLATLAKVWYRDCNATQYTEGGITFRPPLPGTCSSPMQWIGIKDRNGNNIFELDVIERKIREQGETVGIERGLVVPELWYFTIIRFGLDESYRGELPHSDWRPSCELFVTDEEFFENCSVVGNFYENASTLPKCLNTLPKIAERIGRAEKEFRSASNKKES